MILVARGRTIAFPRPPLVMGIVNLGPDSFSGDGLSDPQMAIQRAVRLAGEGADIIDVGAESARTNRAPISEKEEAAALLSFIAKLEEESWANISPAHGAQLFPPLLSINTWRSGVVKSVLAAGGDILNDIGALPDSRNAEFCAAAGAALVIMHSVGLPKVPHTHIRYPDVMHALEQFFEEKMAVAHRAGLSAEALILDPGIDFAKQREDNLRILGELSRLTRFNRPTLLAVSRKDVIGEVLGIADPVERDAGTIASIVAGVRRGAAIVRVHNVAAAVQALRIIEALEPAD